MQERLPTVGDTVTIVQRIVARPGVVIDARPPVDSSVATLIAPPVMTREGDSVRIAYTIAVWTAGHNDLVLPGVVLVDQRGHVDTLADAHVALDVATVLPAAKSTSAIQPQAARPWLPRADRSDLPFVVLVPLTLALLAVVHWQWRRRGPVPPAAGSRAPAAMMTDARIHAWVAAGEARLALEHLEALGRDRDDLSEWRERAAAVRFAPGNEPAAAALVWEAWPRLKSEPP